MSLIGKCAFECYLGEEIAQELWFTQILKPANPALEPALTFFKVVECVNCIAEECIAPFFTTTGESVNDLPCELRRELPDDNDDLLLKVFAIGLTTVVVCKGLQLMSRTWLHYSRRPQEIISHV